MLRQWWWPALQGVFSASGAQASRSTSQAQCVRIVLLVGQRPRAYCFAREYLLHRRQHR